MILHLNHTYSDALAVPLKSTAGDEVQGLFGRPEALVGVIVGVSDAVFPAAVSWGLGRGGITTDLGDDVALLDGPCFHRAREAVGEAKKTSTWVRTGGFAEPNGDVLAGIMNLIAAIRSEWTARQAEVVREARKKRQVEVAEELDIHR